MLLPPMITEEKVIVVVK